MTPADPATPERAIGGAADLAVVGAGIVGAAIAFGALTDRPGSRILVLDQGAGNTATHGSLGVLAPWAATPGQRALLERGTARFHHPRLLALLRPHLRRVPVLVAAGAPTLERLARSTVGTTMGPASPRTVRAARVACGGDLLLWPGDGLATVHGGIAVLDTAAADAALVGAVVDAGGHQRTGARVTRIDTARPRGQRLRLSDGSTVTARRTALATGPWPGPTIGSGAARRTGEGAGAGTRIDRSGETPWRTKRMAALHIDRELPADAPMVCFPDDDLFLLPTPADSGGGASSGGAWVSLRSEQWDVAPHGGPDTFGPDTLDEGCRVLGGRLPRLVAAARAGRAGVDGYTADRTPLTDLPAPGVARASAASGAGARLCWGMADRVLELLAP
ncbi:FAD-binding oxidoreductase [Kitasatospora purpeofusca]|uniref:FAD-dependent oxidoreductase n=1 Tax=Kitasatospora purpeofusca TaxID=67352 RepID=UPI00225902D7|nr:FAD-dependent oxidoreductase [Kitasatospora purpeofusca]MCX4690491.1 FAD-binding oxidoreductase [Kitasatospora purpeofusca]